MEYSTVIEGHFISRPNRFIAMVEVNGQEEICHVKNTGRCKELLISGVRVVLEPSDKPSRKTKFDLIAVYKGDMLINIDSQAPNKVAFEYLCKLYPTAEIHPEFSIGQSRLDFLVEENGEKLFVEVKGCTLEKDGGAYFPDAPTLRGVKHLRELISCVEQGHRAMALFIIQMRPVSFLSPNDETHPEFGAALRLAAESGVEIRAVDCIVEKNVLLAHEPVEIRL